MQSMNGILILSPEERAALEATIGPLTSCRVEDIRLQLIHQVERKEAEGYFLWARFIRDMLQQVTEVAGGVADR